MIRRWRRLDDDGLEVFRLDAVGADFEVRSSVVSAGKDPFALNYTWTLDGAWRTRRLRLDIRAGVDRSLTIERAGSASWWLDGTARPDLDGCDEIDLSATPFCNSLAIRRLDHKPGELTALYLDCLSCRRQHHLSATRR